MAGRSLRHQPMADLVLGISEQDEEERGNPELILTPAREDALEKWKQNPWDFLTGVDPDTGEAIIRTVDQKDKNNPIKAFPGHLEYLHYLVDLLEYEPKLILEKASQMVTSTTILLLMAWRCSFRDGYKVLLSKHKEEEAEILLDEKVRTIWSLMPLWLSRQIPVSRRPKNRLIFSKPKTVESTILGLTESAASGEARGQTYQVGLVDEAEYQEVLRDLITAMLPRCGQLVIWSTPARGGDGVAIFRDYLGDDVVTARTLPDLAAIKKRYAIPGMSIRRNNDRNFTIARIEHSAAPAKRSKEWEEATKKEYPSLSDFRREMKIDRTSNIGKPFYPQFGENHLRYIARCDTVPKDMPILRGWDFGKGNPACVWGIWSAKSKRFWAVRELLGFDIDTYQFRDLVRYLSGQISIETLNQHERAMQMLDELRMTSGYPEGPWFGGRNRFYDFAGHEGVMGGRGLQKTSDAKTAAEILALEDIHLYAQLTPQHLRTDLINGLSRMRECSFKDHGRCDGHPGILLDPACVLLIKGLTEGIVYAKATPQHPDPNEPMKDAIYSHLHEALGYTLRQVVALEDANFFQASFGADGQLIMPEIPQDSQVYSYLMDGVNP
ncbi:MAG: hypothetical protein E4G90_04495 [Gemmatimonadales bacterium]|nr:MAG: hypothetical protein E4G90_04495 [Gemmatimonadales bacterium]